MPSLDETPKTFHSLFQDAYQEFLRERSGLPVEFKAPKLVDHLERACSNHIRGIVQDLVTHFEIGAELVSQMHKAGTIEKMMFDHFAGETAQRLLPLLTLFRLYYIEDRIQRRAASIEEEAKDVVEWSFLIADRVKTITDPDMAKMELSSAIVTAYQKGLVDAKKEEISKA